MLVAPDGRVIEIRGLPGTDVPGYVLPLLRSWSLLQIGVCVPLIRTARAASQTEVKIPTQAKPAWVGHPALRLPIDPFGSGDQIEMAIAA